MDIMDIKPPVDIPNPWFWVWVALGVAAVILALWLLRRWRQAKQAEASRPVYVPSHVRARQRLTRALDLVSNPKPFCIEVSDTIRLYLEERFSLHAPERTTEEFLHELQTSRLLLDDQKRSLGEFLEQCDLVKFAKFEPAQSELESLHGAAWRLVEETQPNLITSNIQTPAPPEAAPTTAA